MQKISEGTYELFTTKEDAIHKFMQMDGLCREEFSDENCIHFYCSEKGKITIDNVATRHADNANATALFANVTTQNGKTYVTYYTAFSKASSVSKIISLALSIVSAVLVIILALYQHKPAYLIGFLFILAFYVFKFSRSLKETENSPKDSEILIRELEKRVQAVNLWDK